MPNITLGTSRARLNDLKSQRASFLENAEKQLNAGNNAEYKSLMAQAQALNPQIEDLDSLVKEYDRYDIAHAPKFGTDAKDMQEMGKMLMAGERVGFAADLVQQALVKNAVTFSGDLVAPTGGNSQVHDGFNAQVSGLIDQVRVETFDGLAAWEESYLKSIQTATHGKPETVAGTTRSDSSPEWRKAKLMAHEVQTTSFVDRNIAKLSPVAYASKVQGYALKALRREVNNLIINGDGAGSPEVFGMINAKNTQAENIFATAASVTAIDEDTLRSLVFGYGGDEELSASARLILDKVNLEKLGKIKIAADDKRPLFDISQTGNTGAIKAGGLIVPYTIASAIGSSKLAYGDPMSYLLALFGSYTVRVDESVKSVERMIAILGDVMVGGNLVMDKGMLIANLT